MTESFLTWWRVRSDREQQLLAAISVLLLLLSGLLIARPVFAWRSSAHAAAQTAENEFGLIGEAASRYSSANASRDLSLSVRAALTTVAGEENLTLTFVNERPGGIVDAQVGQTSPEILFNVISRLDDGYGVKIVAANISRLEGAESDIRATLSLSR